MSPEQELYLKQIDRLVAEIIGFRGRVGDVGRVALSIIVRPEFDVAASQPSASGDAFDV